MTTKPRVVSDIIIGMASQVLRSPGTASEPALSFARLCATIAWCTSNGTALDRDEYMALLKAIEAEDPGIWSELTSSDVDSLVADLVKYKQAHHPDDRRHLLEEALRKGVSSRAMARSAPPFIDPRSESRVRSLVMEGDCNAAVQYLVDDEGVSAHQAVQYVGAIALEHVRTWGGPVSRPSKKSVSAAKRQTGKKPQTKSDFLRKALGRNPELDLRQINQRWTKAGHPGEISQGLYYQVRSKLGIKTTWTWVKTQEPAPGPKPKPVAATGEIYQFKITLRDTQPPIWRRIQVRDGTLDKLHEHIQTAMGWTNSHLHSFQIGETLYADPMLMEEDFKEWKCRDSTTTRLSDVLPPSGKRFAFAYEYDFGDSWNHEVLFEGKPPVEPGKTYPLCLEGARACPPEDVGGTSSYAEFLVAIADPEHEEHGTMLEWVGGKFDPERFRTASATTRMKKGLPDWRRGL